MAFLKGFFYVSIAGSISIIINKLPNKFKNKYYFIKYIPLIPAWYALIKKLKPYNSIYSAGFIAGIDCIYHLSFAFLLNKYIPIEYGLLWIYAPLPLVFERKSFGFKDIPNKNDILYQLYIRIFWSFPIVMATKIESIFSFNKSLNYGVNTPTLSIINDDIALGRFPIYKDIPYIYSNPYNIRCIINMCQEYTGPIELYQKYNIEYHNIKLLDTLPPTIEDVLQCIDIINNFINIERKINKRYHTRIFIHCRGGRSRSATIALCYLISIGMTSNDALKLLIQRRKAVKDVIIHYQCVNDIIKYYDNNNDINVSHDIIPTQRRVLSFHLFD